MGLNDLKVKDIAWPTLGLFICNSLMILLMLCFYPSINYLLYLTITSVLFYINFTPFHESGHNLIASKKYQYINDIVAIGSNFIYTAIVPLWKTVHSQHHLHTNDIELDPDKFYNDLTNVYLYGWFLDYTYAYHYFVKYFPEKSLGEQIYAGTSLGLYFVMFAFILYYKCGSRFFFSCYIPQRISLFLASYILDYNSHHDCPVITDKDVNKEEGTNKIQGIVEKGDYPLLTSLITQNQNYHIVHHMYPMIPFYNYSKLWNERGGNLLKRGSRERVLSDG